MICDPRCDLFWRTEPENLSDLKKSCSSQKILQSLSTNTNISLSSYNEDHGSKFIWIARGAQFVPIGMASFAAIVVYELYKLNRRENTKMSIHQIHMCLATQGFVAGTMTLGMDYSMYQEFWPKAKP